MDEKKAKRLMEENRKLNRFRNAVLKASVVVAVIYIFGFMFVARLPGHWWEAFVCIPFVAYLWAFIWANGDGK